MKFGNAVKRSITAFLDGKMPENMLNETGEDVVFTPDYFDKMEGNLNLSSQEQEDEDADT